MSIYDLMIDIYHFYNITKFKIKIRANPTFGIALVNVYFIFLILSMASIVFSFVPKPVNLK